MPTHPRQKNTTTQQKKKQEEDVQIASPDHVDRDNDQDKKEGKEETPLVSAVEEEPQAVYVDIASQLSSLQTPEDHPAAVSSSSAVEDFKSHSQDPDPSASQRAVEQRADAEEELNVEDGQDQEEAEAPDQE